jgi:hypothetical protein
MDDRGLRGGVVTHPAADDFSIYSADAIDIGVMLFGKRTCSKCHATLPACADYFHADRDRFAAQCRLCRRQAQADSYRLSSERLERRREQQRALYERKYATDSRYREQKRQQAQRHRERGRAAKG